MNGQDDVLSAIQEILGDPFRYGVTWRRLPATVVDASDPTAVGIILDGDDNDTIIPAVSLIGGARVGARVMVDQIPPAGLYVIGQSGANPQRAYSYVDTVVFTATTTVAPSDYLGILAVHQRLIGGGGGGGGAATTAAGQASAAGGGGGGGYSESFLLWSTIVDSVDGYTVTVGTGGAGGAAGANNGTNGNSSRGGGVDAAGGTAGAGSLASATAGTSAGGNGGGASGDFTANGDDGGNGQRFGGFGSGTGFGGGTVLGGIRHCSTAAAGGAGLNARVRGGGGSGGYLQASATQVAGGNGADGVVIWDLFV